MRIVENSDRNQENEESEEISCETENGVGPIGWKLEIFGESKLENGFGGFEIQMDFIDYGVQFWK